MDESVPSWQRSAPKAALYVDKDTASAAGAPDKEPYPKKFEEIIAFLQTGKEIPGIVKIPDTVIDDPVSTLAILLIYYDLLHKTNSIQNLTGFLVDIYHDWSLCAAEAMGEKGCH